MILIIILYMLLASMFTVGKAALVYTKPIFFVGIRMVVAGIILLSYSFLFTRRSFSIKKAHGYLFLQIILLHIYGSYVAEYIALQYVTSAKACFLFNLSPFISAVLSYFYFHEHITPKKLLGLVIGFIGFLPVLLVSTPHENLKAGAFFFLSYAEILLFFSVLFAAQGWIVMRILVRDKNYSPIMVNGIGMFFGGILALITSYIIEGYPLYAVPNSLYMLILYAGITIIVANIICYNLYGYLLKYYSATFLSLVGFICPIFASIYGYLFLHEIVSVWFFPSILIVFFGLYIFYQEEKKTDQH